MQSFIRIGQVLMGDMPWTHTHAHTHAHTHTRTDARTHTEDKINSLANPFKARLNIIAVTKKQTHHV